MRALIGKKGDPVSSEGDVWEDSDESGNLEPPNSNKPSL